MRHTTFLKTLSVMASRYEYVYYGGGGLGFGFLFFLLLLFFGYNIFVWWLILLMFLAWTPPVYYYVREREVPVKVTREQVSIGEQVALTNDEGYLKF